jgi:hypothetical protein
MEKTTNSTKTLIKPFPFTLDTDEKLNRGERLSQEIQSVYDAREGMKESAKSHKKVVETAEKRVRDLREVVATGVEWRDVECEERFYRSTGEVVTIRLDTGETVDIRPMTVAERQQRFEFGGDEK